MNARCDMTTSTRTIHVAPGSELDRLIEDLGKGPIALEKDGVRYRVERIDAPAEDDPWANYDPEAVRAALRATAGSWRDVDAEALKAYIYRAREEGTRPPDRP